MSSKHIAAFACMVLLAACSDKLVAPPEAQKPPAAVAKDPSPVVAVPSPDDHSARFEFYFKGQLQRVLRGSEAASPQNYDEFTSTNFQPLVEMMDRRPANSRTARVANLLRGLDKIPENARAAAFEARANALLKETPHTLTKLADGTRVLEFRFDGQLAGRAVIPATVTLSGSKRVRDVSAVGGGVSVIGMTTSTGDDCSGCWTEADEIYYWGIMTYLMDQAAEIDADAAYVTYSSPIAAFDISAEGNCLKEYSDFLLTSAVYAGLLAGANWTWENITTRFISGSITSQTAGTMKLSLVAGAVKGLQSVWASWNSYRNCLWKNW